MIDLKNSRQIKEGEIELPKEQEQVPGLIFKDEKLTYP